MNLLNEVRGNCIISLLGIAYKLLEEYETSFRPYMNGIYRKNTLIPILVPNVVYHKERTFEPIIFNVFNSVEDLDILNLDKNESIINSSCDTLLFPYELNNKKQCLTTEPYFNPNVIKFIKDYTLFFISSNIPYANDFYPSMDYSTLTDVGVMNFTQGIFENVLSDYLDEIYDFIAEDKWAIYFVDLLTIDIVIKRSVDYRIYQWTLQNDRYTK